MSSRQTHVLVVLLWALWCPILNATVAPFVDGCALTHVMMTSTASEATEQMTLNLTSGIHFTDCVLTQPVDIVVAVEQPSGSYEFPPTRTVEIHNTTMSGGSFTVVPHGSQSMENVQIAVKDSTLNGAGHVLVVTTSNGGSVPVATDDTVVNNVAINIVNSRLSSTTGSVASIIAGNGAVNGSSILIGDNCNLQGKYLVASVVTNKFLNSALQITPSRCSNIQMRAGDENTVGQIGVLGVFATHQNDGAMLHVENVELLVSNNIGRAHGCHHGRIFMQALGLEGAAATAGVMVKHPQKHAQLSVTGNLTIDVHFVDSESLPFRSTHVMLADVAHSHSSATVGGVIVSTNSSQQTSTSSMSVFGGLLRISVVARNSGLVTIGASSGVYDTAAVFGVALCSFAIENANSYARLSVAKAQVIIISSLTNCDSIVLSATTPVSRGSCALLGVTVFDQTAELSTVMVSLVQKSHVMILSSITQCRHVDLSAKTTEYAASTVLGLAMCNYSPGRSTIPPQRTIFVEGGTTFNITARINDCDNVSLTTSGKVSGHTASSILGVAMFSHSFLTTASASIFIDSGSTVNIATHIHGCRALNISVVSEHMHGASAALGVAMSTHCGVAHFSIDTSSRLSINALLADSVAISVNTPNYTAAALLGLVVKGTHGAETKIQNGASSQQTNVAMWVGARNFAEVTATTGTGALSGVIGLASATAFLGFTESNTVLSFCADDTVRVMTSQGAVVNVQPAIAGVLVNSTRAWQPTNDPINVEQPAAWCNGDAVAVERLVEDVIDHTMATLNLADQPTFTTSRSRSEATESPSAMHSSSVSSSVTFTISTPLSHTASLSTPPHTDAPEPPPTTTTPARTRTVQITTNVMLPGNENAATVVLSTAGVSNAVASQLGSSGGGVLVTAGASVRMMECGLAEDDPRPGSFELPIQFPIGSGSMRYFAGAALGHTLLHAFMFSLPMVCRYLGAKRGVVKCLSLLFCGAHPFFTPAILGACSTVLNNDDDELSLAVSSASALVIVLLHCAIVLAIHRGPQHGIVACPVRSPDSNKMKLHFDAISVSTTTTTTRSSSSKSSSTSTGDDSESALVESSTNVTNPHHHLFFSGQATKELLLTLFDGCRMYEKASHRHYTSVEVTLFSIIAVVSGARPQENCSAAAFAIGALAALQLVYVVAIRPFRTKLDTIFSFLNGLVLVALCGTVAASLQQRGSDVHTPHQRWAADTMETCLWLVSGLGYTQLVVQCCWAYYVLQRRQAIGLIDEDTIAPPLRSINSSSDEDIDDQNPNSIEEPLLSVVEMKSEVAPVSKSNPLREEST